VLTDEQISALDGRVNEFRAANYEVREEIVREFLDSFKNACPQGVEFNEVAMKTVHAPSATLGCSQTSHIFLAYSPGPLWQNQTGN
jgi:hypothetical protein